MANYADSSDATTYFTTRLNTSAWDDASDADKLSALTMATRIIDSLSYLGEVTDTDQDNQFPRDDDTEVPQDIVDACCEIALALLDGVDPDKELEMARMLRFTYDAATTTYRPNMHEHVAAGVPSVAAWRLLRPYLRDNNSFDLKRIS